MYNGDLDQNLTPADSSPNLDPEPEESNESPSTLDQHIDAAIRDVEDLLVAKSGVVPPQPATARPSFDWSTPNLVEEEEAPLATEDSEVKEGIELETAGEDFETQPDSIEEAELREFLRALEKRILEIADERQQSESRLLVNLETEAALQAEVSNRRREEDELRRQTEEAAVARREEDEARIKGQREQVGRIEGDLKRMWSEERRLRSEVVRMNQTVHEVLQKRIRAEEDAKLALLAEAQRARDEAEEIHLESLARLHSEEEALRRAVTRYSLRRTELEADRQKHETETRKLDEERAQISAAAAARMSETARLRSEAEEKLRHDQEQLAVQEAELSRLRETLSAARAELELARKSAEEDTRRLAEARARMDQEREAIQQAERERLLLEAQIFERAETERRLLEEVRARADEQQRQLELNARQRLEREAERIAGLDALKIAAQSSLQLHSEREQLVNEELESIRSAEQAVLSRIEELEVGRTAASESHQRMMTKLKRVEEEANARAAEESQARTDLERRIKEETDNLRRLEIEHRLHIDEEVARRIEAEKRLQETKNRYQAEQAARIKAELQFEVWNEPAKPVEADADKDESEPEVVADSSVPVYQVGNLSSPDPRLRADAVTALARLGSQDSYDLICNCFDDESPLVRNAAARAMLTLEPHRPVEPFTRAIKEAGEERRGRIGAAISESGLAAQSINALSAEDREDTYNGLCLLFAMAKAGEVDPLVRAIETHTDAEVRLAAIRLLKLSGKEELASAAVERRLRTTKE